MKKPNIEEWASDCNKLGIASRRLRYSNTGLVAKRLDEDREDLENTAGQHSRKYAIDTEFLLELSYILADCVDLGTAY